MSQTTNCINNQHIPAAEQSLHAMCSLQTDLQKNDEADIKKQDSTVESLELLLWWRCFWLFDLLSFRRARFYCNGDGRHHGRFRSFPAHAAPHSDHERGGFGTGLTQTGIRMRRHAVSGGQLATTIVRTEGTTSTRQRHVATVLSRCRPNADRNRPHLRRFGHHLLARRRTGSEQHRVAGRVDADTKWFGRRTAAIQPQLPSPLSQVSSIALPTCRHIIEKRQAGNRSAGRLGLADWVRRPETGSDRTVRRRDGINTQQSDATFQLAGHRAPVNFRMTAVMPRQPTLGGEGASEQADIGGCQDGRLVRLVCRHRRR